MATRRIFRYSATVERVIDGDTLELTLDLGLRIFRREPCRLLGINAPELSAVGGIAALGFVSKLCPPGTVVTFVSKELDKYGRPLGSIVLPSGADLASEVLAAGHARPIPV